MGAEAWLMGTGGMWFSTEGTRPRLRPFALFTFDEFRTPLLLFVARYPSRLQPFSPLLLKRFVCSALRIPAAQTTEPSRCLHLGRYIYYRKSHGAYRLSYSTEMVLGLSAGSAVAMATGQGCFLSGKFFYLHFQIFISFCVDWKTLLLHRGIVLIGFCLTRAL